MIASRIDDSTSVLEVLDLETHRLRELVRGTPSAPAIDGDLVCFAQGYAPMEVGVYDLTNSRYLKVSSDRQSQITCDISGRTLVFFLSLENEARLRTILDTEP